MFWDGHELQSVVLHFNGSPATAVDVRGIHLCHDVARLRGFSGIHEILAGLCQAVHAHVIEGASNSSSSEYYSDRNRKRCKFGSDEVAKSSRSKMIPLKIPKMILLFMFRSLGVAGNRWETRSNSSRTLPLTEAASIIYPCIKQGILESSRISMHCWSATGTMGAISSLLWGMKYRSGCGLAWR